MSEEQMAKAEASAADYRSTLAKSLQLEPDVSDDDLARALVTQVSDIFESSDKIKESEERYNGASQQASDNGISHVLSSGNRGTLRDYLDELGVQPDEGFYESSLVTDNTTVVGATDDKGTETLADDTRFEGNAPDAGAEIAAPGTNREMTTLDGRTATRSGTSYAAPEVAAGHLFAGQVQLAGHPVRDRPQPGVQNPHTDGRGREADRRLGVRVDGGDH